MAFEDDDSLEYQMVINKIKEKYPNDHFIFCNGGDRDKNNIPEMVLKYYFF